MSHFQSPALATRRENVVQFVYAISGTYADNYRRSFAPNLKASDHERIIDYIAASPTAMGITSAELTKLAPGMMTVGSPTEYDRVNVANGWQTQRLFFLLTLEVADGFNMTRRYTVNGYSDHADLSLNGSIDPNTVLVINSVNVSDVLSAVSRVGPGGMSTTPHVSTTTSAAAFSSASLNAGSPNSQVFYGMRPYDMFAEVANTITRNGADLGTTIIDNRSVIEPTVGFSAKSNNIAPQFLSKSINMMLQAVNGSENNPAAGLRPVMDDNSFLYNTAANFARDENTELTTFFSALDRKANNVATQCAFRFSDLMRIDPSLTPGDPRIVPVTESQQSLLSVPVAGQFENWNVATPEAAIANQVAVGVNSLMTSMGVLSFAFSANTIPQAYRAVDEGDGSGWNAAIINCTLFNQGLDRTMYSKRLLQRVITELLRDVSKGGQIQLSLVVDANALRNTNVQVSVNGQPMTPFSLPSFADTMLAPVLTNDERKQTQLAQSIEALTSSIADSMNVEHVAKAAQQFMPGVNITGGAVAPPPAVGGFGEMPSFPTNFDPFPGAPATATNYPASLPPSHPGNGSNFNNGSGLL